MDLTQHRPSTEAAQKIHHGCIESSMQGRGKCLGSFFSCHTVPHSTKVRPCHLLPWRKMGQGRDGKEVSMSSCPRLTLPEAEAPESEAGPGLHPSPQCTLASLAR